MSPSSSQSQPPLSTTSSTTSSSPAMPTQTQPTARPSHPTPSRSTPTSKTRPPTLLRSISSSAGSRVIPKIMTRAPTAGSGSGFKPGGGNIGWRRLEGSGIDREGRQDRDHLGITTSSAGAGRADKSPPRIGEEGGGSKTDSGHLGAYRTGSTLDGSSRNPQPFTYEALDDPALSNEALPAQPTQPPFFAPFFTLIHDLSGVENVSGGGGGGAGAEEGKTYHARRVRYLFSDDDVGELVAAAAAAGDAYDRDSQEEDEDGDEDEDEDGEDRSGRDSGARLKRSETTESSSSNSTARRRKSGPGPTARDDGRRRQKGKQQKKSEERIIVVDISPEGDAVSRAVSLCANWQLVNAEVVGAPMWGGEGEGVEKVDGSLGGRKALMLRVEGVGRRAPEEGDEARGMEDEEEEEEGGEGDMLEEDIDDEQMRDLLDGFEREMDVLRRVVGHGAWALGREGGDGGVVGVAKEGERDQGGSGSEEGEKEEG